MENYTRTNRCLSEYIVNYFGDALEESCGTCGNCENEGEVLDITIDAQKIISCIGRLNDRFGVKLISEVLKGANTAKIKDYRLNEQSTYACLKDKSLEEIKIVIDYMIGHEYLKVSEGKYPLIKLTEKAYSFIRSKETLFMKVLNSDTSIQKSKKSLKNNASLSLIEGGENLFKILAKYRTETAAELRVPPYVVFSDKTLIEICNYKPRNKAELLGVNGMGEVKFQKYGDSILSILNKYIEETNDTNISSKLEISTKSSSTRSASYKKTAELFIEGLSIEEIASTQQIVVTTVLNHLSKAKEEMAELDLSRLYTAEEKALLVEAVEKVGIERLKPIKESLPEYFSYD
ncbi:MAG: RQC domain-containing protein, partial [Cetobacterium sp.]